MSFSPLSFKRSFHPYPTLLWVRLFGEALTSASSTMIAPFLVLYLNEHIGTSVALTMLVIGMQPFTEILLTIFAGGVTDRFRRKSVMLLSLLVQALAMLGMAFADSIWLFACSYVLHGAGRALFIPASRAMLADAMAPDQVPSAFALLNTATSLGAVIGPLAGLLLYRHDPTIAFLLTAASLFVYSAAVWWKIPHTDLPYGQAAGEAEKGTVGGKQAWQAYRPAVAIMLLSLPISLFYAQSETNLQLHFRDRIPQYLETLAFLAAAKGILLLCLEFLLVKWTQNLPLKLLIPGSYLCFCLVSLGYAVADQMPVLLALQLVLVIGESIGLTQLLNFVTRTAPVSMRGRFFAITGTHWDISRMCGPYIGSLVMVHFGGSFLFLLTALLLLIGALLMHRYLHRHEKDFAA